MSQSNLQSGFTLIETFVAVLILVFAVIGPLGLLSRAINDGNYAKNQVTAYYLAQEATELIINQRDQNLAASVDWLNDLGNCVGDDCQIGLDLNQQLDIRSCDIEATISNCLLYIQDDLGQQPYYTHTNTGRPAIFRRTATINEDEDSASITVKVVWVNKTNPVELELTTIIYNQGIRTVPTP
ncbi:MAG: hypothetical protein A2589_03225 [Candidatus Vogelbacteria bacterium RIFOXYD1_FULL_46_19]|uniref:Prepilin-type N-terminal cleavage/methylation domain-containing protein n=1 Tax=Candidatus Vogelbacteria bacterium RIFOXYD1_FULL_46_19 TaxID=1802439 RepID=A0A1G2QGW9_9BACT|nr:MAG: hypothetical protein A2589_03225 [Candidatus Vogelbacteria bacterium RIFOXYD1_FULL_46_19]